MVTDKTTSLHQKIIDDLQAEIFSGTLPPGGRIPSENQLAASYGCSRMTVNKAITWLAKAGHITRRMGAGSFVASSQVSQAVIEIRDLGMEIRERGLDHRIELLKREIRQTTRGEEITLGTSKTDVLAIQCRHFAGDKPCALEHRIINLAQAPRARDVDFSKQYAASWLNANVSWISGEHEITAINADAETATLLDVPLGTACLQVERFAWREETKLTYARFIHVGSMYSIMARFSP